MLIFGHGNKKLGSDVLTFSLPAGYTCPGARECLAWAHHVTGKVTDGPEQKFRCFSASQEAAFPSVRKARWANFRAIKDVGEVEMARVILESLQASRKRKTRKVRIHVSGDFFSLAYFCAWVTVARAIPELTFYAYTKSLHFVGEFLATDSLPANLFLTASAGGRFDREAAKLAIRTATVFTSEDAARVLGLPVDVDDSHAQGPGESFALLVHGTQPRKQV